MPLDYQGKNYLTQEGLEKLKAELEVLKNEKRKEIVQKIKEAKEQGDLSENAEYSDAKDEQAFVEGRIVELENLVRNAIIISESKNGGARDEVAMGIAFVTEYDGKSQQFILVGPTEVKPSEGKISYESPLGRAFLGKKVGESVEAETPRGLVHYKIKEIC